MKVTRQDVSLLVAHLPAFDNEADAARWARSGAPMRDGKPVIDEPGAERARRHRLANTLESDRMVRTLKRHGWVEKAEAEPDTNSPAEAPEKETVMDKKIEKMVVPNKTMVFDVADMSRPVVVEDTSEQESKAAALAAKLGSWTETEDHEVEEHDPGDVVRGPAFLEPHQERDAFQGVLERTPYGIRHGDGVQPTLRVGPNYLPAGDSGLVTPLDFKAPTPGPIRKYRGLGGGLFSNLIKQGNSAENGKL